MSADWPGRRCAACSASGKDWATTKGRGTCTGPPARSSAIIAAASRPTRRRYGGPLPVVDANVRRVLMRILGIRGPADPAVDRKLRPFLEAVLPATCPGDFNQAMMELGALVCRSRLPTG